MLKKMLSVVTSFILVMGLLPSVSFAQPSAVRVSTVSENAAANADPSEYALTADSNAPLSDIQIITEQQTDSLTTLSTNDGTQPDSGYCGDDSDGSDGKNVAWSYDGAGTLTLTGTGSTAYYNENNSWYGFSCSVPGWYDYRESITKVIIGEGITCLNSALLAHTSITSITLPSTVKEISQIVFTGCSQLTSITLNEGLETIGYYAFGSAPLASLYIPSTVKSIDATVLYDMDFSIITIAPKSPYLKLVGNLLYSADMTELLCMSRQFSGTLTIPSTVKKVADEACANRQGLTGLVLPDSLESIGAKAFGWTNITSVVIPDSVTEIGRSAFQCCYNLTYAKLGSGYKGSTDAYSNSMFAYDSALATVELSEGLEVVDERMFGGCTALTSVKIPSTVVEICEDAFNTTGLTSVLLPAGLKKIDNKPFANTSLSSVTLPEGLESIGQYAFYATNITAVTIPESVTSVGKYAFPDDALISTSLVKIADGTYVSTSAITTLEYDVTYVEEDSRSMLAMINDFRTGSDAWYYSTDSTTKVYQSGLGTLQYDKNLEAIAQQRAAEIAIYFAHERPDGQAALTASSNGIYASGENIAAGLSTASAAFEAWQETNYGYSGQGHRRNMLDSSWTCVGIGHVVYNGIDFWVQEFSSMTTITAPDTAQTTTEPFRVTIPNSQFVAAPETAQFSASYLGLETAGASATAPNTQLMSGFRLKETWPYSFSARVIPYWTSSDASQAKVENGLVTCLVDNPTASIEAYYQGKKISLPLSKYGVAFTVGDDTYAAGYKLVTYTAPVRSGQVPAVKGTAFMRRADGALVLIMKAADAESLKTSDFSFASGTAQSLGVRGDVTGNSTVNVVDAQVAYDLATGVYKDFARLSMSAWLRADANYSGAVDAADAQAVQHFALAGSWK